MSEMYGITVNVVKMALQLRQDGQINDTFTFTQVFVGTMGDDIFNGSDTSGEPDRSEFFCSSGK